MRRQLIAQKGYSDTVLPTAETIGTKLNDLGSFSQKVAKSQPPKLPETDAIFDQVTMVNGVADTADTL